MQIEKLMRLYKSFSAKDNMVFRIPQQVIYSIYSILLANW